MSADTITEARLRDFVEDALRKLNVPDVDVARTADVIVEADLRGVDSHGVRAFASRVPDLLADRIRPAKSPIRIGGEGALAHYDGQHGYGPLLCSAVAIETVSLASQFGIGMSVMRNSSHWGCPGYYSRSMAMRGFIGIAMTNTNPAMPLWGSSAKSVGNNPITIAAPRRNAEPVVLDISMQQIAWGGLQLARQDGRRLPGKWGFDTTGTETDDPAAIIDSGRVRPMGDHKGSGLAFMLEILTGVVSAGAVCYAVGDATARGEPAHYCQSFIAIRPDSFASTEGYFDALEQLYTRAKSAPLAEGFSEISLPGDRSACMLVERRRNGIPLSRIRPALTEISEILGVPAPM